MPIPPIIEQAYLRIMDAAFARWPQPAPEPAALENARVIAHRGEHDNKTTMENSLAAFDRALGTGLWGIELDVRWSADLVPVVAHDADLVRLYGIRAEIARLTFQELRRIAPQVPPLADVVGRFGRRLHLMIEIKEPLERDTLRQSRILKETLSGLDPLHHYHLIALHPHLLTRISGFPPESYLAIAYHWPDRFSRWVLRRPWGGLCAHYGLMRSSLIRRHQACGQKVGTAYPASRNCLFREINRGVDWIFSNHAATLQGLLARQRSLVST